MENLGKSLSVEWASAGVRVNSVAPGVIFSPTAEANYSLPILDLAKDKIPVKRLGTPAEVKNKYFGLLVNSENSVVCPY